MTEAEQGQDREALEAEWEERTRPSRAAPRVKSQYLRKDYAAACPEQHLAYIHCLKETKSWLPTSVSACNEEYKAFDICRRRARAVNGPDPGVEDQERPSMATLLWQDFQREPLVIAAKMGLQEWLDKLGLDYKFDISSQTGSSGSTSTSQQAS